MIRIICGWTAFSLRSRDCYLGICWTLMYSLSLSPPLRGTVGSIRRRWDSDGCPSSTGTCREPLDSTWKSWISPSVCLLSGGPSSNPAPRSFLPSSLSLSSFTSVYLLLFFFFFFPHPFRVCLHSISISSCYFYLTPW